MQAIRALMVLTGLTAFASGALAQAPTYPAKPVRVVIVFPPAGATDIVGRVAYQKVGEQPSAPQTRPRRWPSVPTSWRKVRLTAIR